MKTLVPILLMIGALNAPAPSQTTTPAAQVGGVEGTVINKLTGAPLRHAHVIYIKVAAGPSETASPISSETDASGHYALTLAAGSYRLWVERPGFARQVYGSRVPDGPGVALTVAPGEQIHELVFQLMPLGAISGRVLDEEGEPLQSAGIQVLRFSYGAGRKQLIPVAGGSSNDRGEYRIFGLPAGRYYLQASLRGAPISHPIETAALIPEAQDPFAAMYYPGVPDLASAVQVSLGQGSEMNDADFRMQRVRAVTLRGRLLSPAEDFSRSQIQVVLAHNEGGFASYSDRAMATVDHATGRFELRGVAPGSYLLVASQLSGGRAFGGRTALEVNSPASLENLTVTLRPAFDINGIVELEGKSPGSLPGMTIRLAPSEGLALGPQPSARIAQDGSLHLAGVTSGLWDFTLDPLPDGVWIKSAVIGDRDVLHGELSMPDGPQGALRILLTSNGAQVSGTVSEDNHPHRATVVLAPDSRELRGSARAYRVASAQEQGTFVFRSVPPGAYRLFAFEDVEPYAWLDADLLRQVEALGEPVTLAEGEHASRQLVLIPPEMLIPHP
jgi:hypothetical protein